MRLHYCHCSAGPYSWQALANHRQAKHLSALSSKDKILNNVNNTESGCWEWLGRPDKYGYCQAKFDGYEQTVHRVAYREFIAPIPDRFVVHHKCLNRRCCNPRHLHAMTGVAHGRLHRTLDAERRPRPSE